jgi:hypothetical protein
MIRIEVEISASVIQTIDTYSKVIWQHQLNGNSFFEVLVTGSDEDYAGYFQRGRVINFYKNDVLDLKGEIEKITFTSEGLMRIQGIELGAKRYSNSSIDNASYTTDTNAVITKIQTLTNNSVPLTNIENDSFDSFRTHSNQNCLQVLSKLAVLQGKDWYFDYSGGNVRVNVVNNKGASKVALLNGGIDVDVVTKEEDDTKKVGKVTFIGAGEGDPQICCWWPTVGWTQGDAEITCTDKSIATNAEAQERAKNEYESLGATKYNYFFKVVDFNRSFATGDTIELVDKRTNTDAELRIVSIKRVATQDAEKLELEVRSTSDRERAEDKLRQDAALRSYVDNNNDMVQGADLRGLCACVTGDVCACALSVTPAISICYAGAITCQGYFFGGYSEIIYYNSWRAVGNTVTVPSNANSQCKYLGHGVFVGMTAPVYHDGNAFTWICKEVSMRIYNTSNGVYFPSSSGIKLSCSLPLNNTLHTHCQNIPVHCHDLCITCIYYDHRHSSNHCHGYLNVTVYSYTDNRCPLTCTGLTTDTGYLCNACLTGAKTCSTVTCTLNNVTCQGAAPFTSPNYQSTFIWLPFDWYNTTYRLEYWVSSCCAFGLSTCGGCLNYSYYGILGHNHGNSGTCCNLSHCHCANLVGNVCYCICYM